MSVVELHMSQRRDRILEAARRIIGRRGVEGLTMRDLADAAGVTPPTVYNLVGGKDAILASLLAQVLERALAATAAFEEGSPIDRAFAVSAAGYAELLAQPEYARALLRHFITTNHDDPLRRAIDVQHTAMMAEVLRDAQAAGEIEAWIDAEAVSQSLYAPYVMAMIRWAKGDLDDAGLSRAARLGMALVLLGIARGATRARMEVIAREAQAASTAEAPKRRRKS